MDEIISDYRRIEKAIRFIDDRASIQPSLDDIAAHVGLSPFHFQRLFSRWAGVSPKKFLQYLTVEHAKKLIDNSASVLDAALDVGLSGPSRLHDLFVRIEAVSPGEYKAMGKGLEIRYGIHDTPFGECLLATSPRGICSLEFLDAAAASDTKDSDSPSQKFGLNAKRAIEELAKRWEGARCIDDPEPGKNLIAAAFSPNGKTSNKTSLRLFVKGSNFQVRVWKALLSIPQGNLVSYGTFASMIDEPKAARAVGTAIGNNPIGYLIPCHRVLRATGEFGGYKWGLERKRALIAYESSRLT
jgi:AraC family transcriptional regulator of adaptative response/methylated-DNA-[protein]-cysteine methyltransferase